MKHYSPEEMAEVREMIQAALGNGADEDAWRPGEHWADAAVRAIREARAHASTVDNLQARLDDVRAIARVIELAKASTVEEWDHGTLLRDVLERLDRKPRETPCTR